MQKKIIIILSILLCIVLAYMGYQNRAIFMDDIKEINQGGTSIGMTENLIADTGSLLMMGITGAMGEDDEYSEAENFIKNLSNDGVSVDFNVICMYAKDLLTEYVQQPNKYLVVYKKSKDEYGNDITNKSWDYADVYDVSKKDEIQASLQIQQQLLAVQPPLIQILPGSLGYAIKVNNSNYFWIETRRDESYQYDISYNIILSDVNERPKEIVHAVTISNECEEPEFGMDVAGLEDLLVNKNEIKNITNNYTVNNRRNVLNNFISHKNVQKVKDTQYGSIVLANDIINSQGTYMVYITINHGKLIAIPISFTDRIGDEGDNIGRLLGAIRKKDGSYPRLMQPGSCPEHNQQGYGPYDYCDKTKESIRNYIQSLIDGRKQSPYFDALVDSFERAINDLYIQ